MLDSVVRICLRARTTSIDGEELNVDRVEDAINEWINYRMIVIILLDKNS